MDDDEVDWNPLYVQLQMHGWHGARCQHEPMCRLNLVATKDGHACWIVAEISPLSWPTLFGFIQCCCPGGGCFKQTYHVCIGEEFKGGLCVLIACQNIEDCNRQLRVADSIWIHPNRGERACQDQEAEGHDEETKQRGHPLPDYEQDDREACGNQEVGRWKVTEPIEILKQKSKPSEQKGPEYGCQAEQADPVEDQSG